jgi:hypothetical protein
LTATSIVLTTIFVDNTHESSQVIKDDPSKKFRSKRNKKKISKSKRWESLKFLATGIVSRDS